MARGPPGGAGPGERGRRREARAIADTDEGPLGLRTALTRFIDSSASYWVAMMLVGVLNLGFTVIATHWLRVVRYGELAALVALVNLVLVAVEAVTRTVAGITATVDDKAQSAWILQRASRWLIPIGVVGGLIVIALARPLAQVLHLSQPRWLWVVAFSLLPGYAGSVNTGTLQGLRLFRITGGVNLAAAVLKSATLVTLLKLGMGVLGGIVATVTEVTVVWLGNMWMLARFALRHIVPRPAVTEGGFRNLLALPVALTVARLLFFNVDILMARHYLYAVDAGLFAGLAAVGRIIAYGTGPLPPVAYPYLVRYRGQPYLTSRCLMLSMGATAVIGGLLLLVFYFAPATVVRLLWGADFESIAPYVGWYCLGFLFYSLAYITLHYLLAIETWWVWAYAIGGSALEVAALAVFHAGIGQFTVVVTLFFAFMFLLTGVQAAADIWRRSRAAGRAPRAAGAPQPEA